MAVAFIRMLYATEDLAEWISIPDPLIPAIGALGLGLSGVLYLQIHGADSGAMPPFFGNGYSLIKQVIDRADVLEMSVGLLLGLGALKLLATVSVWCRKGVSAPMHSWEWPPWSQPPRTHHSQPS